MSDRLVAVLLAGVVLVMRVPFAAQTLWAWDSVLYARALEQGFYVGIDLPDQRPHPPGYLFYLAIAAAARLVTRDSNAALVAISVLASALTAGAVYLVSRRYADRPLAAIVALAAACAPLAWTYGEVAMPYALLGLLSVVLAVALRDARTRPWPAAFLASAALGFAGGLRQDLLLLLGPMWLWMLAARSWRERVLCIVAVGAAALAWFGPSATLSGGPLAYLATLGGQATRVSELSPAAGGGALLRNILLTVYALWWGLLGFAAVLVAALVVRLRQGRVFTEDAAYFALWLFPAALVYVTIHIGDPGYLMSVLPGLYVAVAALLAPLARRAPTPIITTTALLAFINAAVFTFGDAPFSASAIARHDRVLAQRVSWVRGLAPASTAVLAQSEYLTARYYLPEYRVLFDGTAPEVLSRRALEVRLTGPMNVVFFGSPPSPFPSAVRLDSGGDVTSGTINPGATLTAFDLEPR